jgi:hypothetical protein
LIPTRRISRGCSSVPSTTAKRSSAADPCKRLTRIHDETVVYNGPPLADNPPGEARIGIFGRQADKLAAGVELQRFADRAFWRPLDDGAEHTVDFFACRLGTEFDRRGEPR